MEDEFYGSKNDLNKLNNFDLLVIGINPVHWIKYLIKFLQVITYF